MRIFRILMLFIFCLSSLFLFCFIASKLSVHLGLFFFSFFLAFLFLFAEDLKSSQHFLHFTELVVSCMPGQRLQSFKVTCHVRGSSASSVMWQLADYLKWIRPSPSVHNLQDFLTTFCCYFLITCSQLLPFYHYNMSFKSHWWKQIFVFSCLPHTDGMFGWYNSQVWDLGHCRTRTVSQLGTYVLQRSPGCHRGLWYHQHSE